VQKKCTLFKKCDILILEGEIDMLINYSVKGFKSFNEKVTLSMEGNKKIANKDNVFIVGDEEILKSAIIYGPNNTGKSTLIDSISWLKKIIIDGQTDSENNDNFTYAFVYNFFNPNKQIDYEIEFLENNIRYKYELSFKLETVNGHKGNTKIVNEKLYVNGELEFDRFKTDNEEEMQKAVNLISMYNNKLIISALPNITYTNDIKSFFKNMNILNSRFNNKLISDIKGLNKKDFEKFKKIIKNADISIDDLEFIDGPVGNDHIELSLFSSYKMNGKSESLPSVIGDSFGTMTFMKYIYYIISTIKTGGVIIIDELDDSLHTLLTKSIIAMFNNEDNKNIQLIASSHDLLLLDAKYLFRKDQIWFTYKDDKQLYLYSLNDFKANVDEGIRNKTMESYLKGMFGALPHPDILDYIYDED